MKMDSLKDIYMDSNEKTRMLDWITSLENEKTYFYDAEKVYYVKK